MLGHVIKDEDGVKRPVEAQGGTLLAGVQRFARDYDAAQRKTGDERRRAEGAAAARLRGWILREFPEDQSPSPGTSGTREPSPVSSPSPSVGNPRGIGC